MCAVEADEAVDEGLCGEDREIEILGFFEFGGGGLGLETERGDAEEVGPYGSLDGRGEREVEGGERKRG